MGILDFLQQPDQSGLLNGLPASWQYQAPVDPEALKKKQDADFMASISQNPYEGVPPSFAGNFPPSAAPVSGTYGGAAPFGLGGLNPSAVPAPQGVASSGVFPAIPPQPTQQPAPVQASPQVTPPPLVPTTPPKANPAVSEDDQPDSMIPIGKYQMPAFAADDETPPAKGAPTDVSAASRQPAPTPSFLQPQSTGGFGSAMRGAMANMQGGPLGMIGGAIAGGMGMGQGSPQDVTKQNQKAQYDALTGSGLSPQEAMLAILNPEAGKVIIANKFGPGKFQHVAVKNPDGSETPQAFNPDTGQYSGAAQPPPGRFSVDPTLTGQDRLEALRAVDPLYARKIESMVAGDFPMPTGVAALRPDAKRMIEDALAVDGATSASDFQTRAATRKDYASGIASRVTKSINTTIGHFATLDQAVDKLGNYTYFPKISNAIHDAYSSNLDPNYQKAKSTFEANKEAAVKELDFALSGGHSSVSGSAELRDKFNRADSPEALHAAITEAMSLLQKRLESHTKAFTEGTKSQRDPQDFIYPENRQAFGRLLGQPDQGTPMNILPPGNYAWSPKTGVVGGK